MMRNTKKTLLLKRCKKSNKRLITKSNILFPNFVESTTSKQVVWNYQRMIKVRKNSIQKTSN